jgi:Flp pilus assembly protein TadD
LNQRKLGEAEDVLREAPSAFGYNQLAWKYATTPVEQFRNPALAVELAHKAVELAPQDGNIWNTLGIAHYRAGNRKAAIAALDKSMDLRNGGDSDDFFFLAMAHWELGNKDEARKWYEKAVEWMEKNNPNNPELERFRAEAAELLAGKPVADANTEKPD